MKTSDYIVQFLHERGLGHVFTVSGAGDLHILDSVRRHPKLEYICNHHEQACGMGAYAYARATDSFGCCLVTTGPGGTNAITGICSAWTDSIPVFVISGQVKYTDTIVGRKLPLRQYGVQEINIVDIARPFTKYAAMIERPQDVRYHLEKAFHLMMEGRPGPIWLDVPMDVQAAQVDPESLRPYVPKNEAAQKHTELAAAVEKTVALLQQAERPVILAGHGIKMAGAKGIFQELVERLQIPILTTWNGIDLLPSEHPLYSGRPGTYGQRNGNFAIQNCDFLLSIGARLSVPQVGYEYSEFARAASKVYVDVDPSELAKFSPAPDVALCADAGDFIAALLPAVETKSGIESWKERCYSWREKYPTALPEYEAQQGSINSFTFVDYLSDELADDELIVPGASGTSYTCTHQTLRVKAGQKVFTSNGFAEMGFDLPGAIGACIGGGKKRTILITGDGSVQMNLQELQTIIHHQLPIKLFYMNNFGYLTIRHTQRGLFKGEFSGSGPDSGVSFPDMQQLGRVYGFTMLRVSELADLRATIREALDAEGPVICEIVMDPDQLLVPKTSFKQMPDGKLVSPPLEDLFPFLPRDEFRSNMIIPTIKDDFLD